MGSPSRNVCDCEIIRLSEGNSSSVCHHWLEMETKTDRGIFCVPAVAFELILRKNSAMPC